MNISNIMKEVARPVKIKEALHNPRLDLFPGQVSPYR